MTEAEAHIQAFHQSIATAINPKLHKSDRALALACAFSWISSPQGHAFWSAIHNRLHCGRPTDKDIVAIRAAKP